MARELVYNINTDIDSQVGAVVYSNEANIQFNLNTFSKQSDILAALSLFYP